MPNAQAAGSLHLWTPSRKTSKPRSFDCLLQKASQVEREGKGAAGEGREPLPCHWPGTISHCWDSSFLPVGVRGGREDWVGKTHKGRAVHSQTGLIPVGLMLLPPPAPLETSENSDWLRKHTCTTKNYLCRHSRREFLQWHELWCQSCQGTATSHTGELQPAHEDFGKIWAYAMLQQ